MKLIDKYILKQVILYALLCMGMFVFVLVVGKVIRDANDMLAIAKVAPGMVAKMFLMLIIYVINYALPLGLLTSILLVLGRLSAQREIVAMKASGISVYRMSSSVFALAFVGTILCVFINGYYAPYAKAQYTEDLRGALRENPLEYVRERAFIKEFPGYIIYIEEKEENEIKGAWLWELDPAGRVKTFIKAKEGTFGFDEKRGDVLLTLRHGTGEMRDADDPENFKDTSLPLLTYEELSIRLPFGDLFGAKVETRYRKLPSLTVFELMDLKKEFSNEGNSEMQMKVQVEIQRKFSMAFSVLALVLIAVPLGIKASRSETYANMGIALILAMTYYGMVMAIKGLDQTPYLRPDLLIWLPNLLFVCLGIYLLRKANRN